MFIHLLYTRIYIYIIWKFCQWTHPHPIPISARRLREVAAVATGAQWHRQARHGQRERRQQLVTGTVDLKAVHQGAAGGRILGNFYGIFMGEIWDLT